jgi:C4-dicarboxylate-specific signal transduction histidine kinase
MGFCGQLLMYSGRGEASTGVVARSSLVRSLSRLMSVSLSKHATFEPRLEEGLGVEADRIQLCQVLMN